MRISQFACHQLPHHPKNRPRCAAGWRQRNTSTTSHNDLVSYSCRFSRHTHFHATAKNESSRLAVAQGDADTDNAQTFGIYLSDEEVDDLITDAASFICVMDELRPLDPAIYNPFYEVWTRIARIPPEERYRLLDELEPGSLRLLWKASMARYVLDEERSQELFSGVSVWDDYPRSPGQVYEYEGRCERYEFEGGGGAAAVQLRQVGPRGTPTTPDLGLSASPTAGTSGSAPWLRPTPASFDLPVTRFRQLFFVPPYGSPAAAPPPPASAAWDPDADLQEEEEDMGSGPAAARNGVVAQGPPRVYSRVLLPLMGPVDRWWEPLYCRLRVELVLTPVPRDAGADLLLLYPADPSVGDEEEEDEEEDEDVMREGGDGSVSYASRDGEGVVGARKGQEERKEEGAVGLRRWALVGRESLPRRGGLWPAPDPASYPVSPFSGGTRDYLRPAGPGVYVGCAYRQGPGAGEYREENFVYFAIVRRS